MHQTFVQQCPQKKDKVEPDRQLVGRFQSQGVVVFHAFQPGSNVQYTSVLAKRKRFTHTQLPHKRGGLLNKCMGLFRTDRGVHFVS